MCNMFMENKRLKHQKLQSIQISIMAKHYILNFNITNLSSAVNTVPFQSMFGPHYGRAGWM